MCTHTVGDVLERVQERRRAKRCPDCSGVVAIQGFDGEYSWKCVDCSAVGFGYETRSAALEDVGRNRHRH